MFVSQSGDYRCFVRKNNLKKNGNDNNNKVHYRSMCFYDEINGIEDIDFSLSLSLSHPSQTNRMRRKVSMKERKLLMYSKKKFILSYGYK